MLTRNEREETIRQYREMPSPATVLYKCAAGLAFIAGVSLVGAMADPPSEDAAKTAAAMGQEPQRRDSKDAGADSKESPQAAADPRSLSE